jgi:membrane protein DedA with SNARE-associated domain
MVFVLSIISFISLLITHSYATISTFVKSYGYLAIFVLMAMESSTLPIPSEVVLPLAGLFAANGLLNFPLAFIAALLGAIVGSMVDYVIGYYIGKDIVYKHLRLFHIKKESLDNFDAWFAKNGVAAVFLTRLVPIVRTVINFPAGFAKMKLKVFLAYSIAGIVVWDLVLMVFGYFFLSTKTNSVVTIMASIGVFAILLYVVYKLATKRMRKK